MTLCPGDSGGPMVTEIGGACFQIGIIHGASAKCSNEFPGIFIRMDNPEILNFIKEELGSSLPSSRSFEIEIETKGKSSHQVGFTDLI